MPVRSHHLLVAAGLAAGIAAGIFLIDTDPSFFGWLVGAGAAFIAALVSGESLVSSGGGASTRTRSRRVNPALRHWEPSAPPSTNGKHEHSSSEASDASTDRHD